MHKIEQAIRQAISKIDASDAAKRQQVYDTIWQAHEKALQANTDLDSSAQNKQRAELARIIKKVEAEFYPAVMPDKDTLGSVSPAAERPARSVAMTGPEEDEPAFADKAEQKRRHGRKPMRFTGNIIFLILLLMIFLVGWSFYNSLIGGGAPTPVASSPALPTLQDEQNQPGWIRVFDPADATNLSTQGNATATIHNETGARFVRIQNNTAESAAVIEIGQGALRDLRGKTATFNIVARSSGKTATQTGIICDFGNDHVTGRHRFEVKPTRDNLLFIVEIPATITQSAKIFISSDERDKKSAIDIFSVSVRAEE